MTDLAQIRLSVVVDDTPVNKLVKGLTFVELSTKRLQKALEQGKISQDEFNRGTTELVNKVGRLRSAMDTSSVAVEESRKGVNRWGLLVQQTGYQAGDFIVQIQSGTNAFVAFGQQATQLVGILPMFATELGVSALALGGITLGLSIAIPLLTAIGAYFSRTGDSAKSSSKDIDAYAEAVRNLTSEIQKNQEVFLKAKFNTDIFGIASAKQQIENLRIQIPLVKKELDDYYLAVAQAGGISLGAIFGDKGTELEAQLKTLQDQLQTLSDQEEAQRMLNGGLSVASGLQRAAIQDKQEQLRLAKEQAIAEQVSADKATFLKNVFHAMAGETSAISVSLGGWAGEIVAATNAASGLQDFLLKMRIDTGMKGRGLPADTYSMDTAPINTNKLFGNIEFGLTGAAIKPEDKKKTGAPKKDPLVELQKQIDLQEELNGKTEAEKKVREALGDSWATYSPTVIKGLEDQIQKQIELEDQIKSQQEVWDTVQSSMEDAFMSMVSGTESAKDAFKSMALAIIKELYKVLVVQRMVGSFNASTGVGTGIQGFLGKLFTGGSAVSHAGVAGFANGGDIRAGVPIMVGERGPEMIIPKSSGTVLTNGQTKAALGGVSNDNYVVHNNINVTGSDSAMVRQEIAKMIPQISSATKAAMIDAKKRGGQMGAAFR